jgi:hypothetical protein
MPTKTAVKTPVKKKRPTIVKTTPELVPTSAVLEGASNAVLAWTDSDISIKYQQEDDLVDTALSVSDALDSAVDAAEAETDKKTYKRNQYTIGLPLELRDAVIDLGYVLPGLERSFGNKAPENAVSQFLLRCVRFGIAHRDDVETWYTQEKAVFEAEAAARKKQAEIDKLQAKLAELMA